MIEDYNVYQFRPKERCRYIFQGIGIVSILGFLFYQSLFGIFILSPMILPYCKRVKKRLIHNRKWQLNIEFKDAIISLSAALQAGYSAEHAFEEVIRDMGLIYDRNTMIMQELTYILNQLRMNITVEKALMEFGERTGIEDIISFAEVFSTAKRTGGDLIKIIKTSCNTIQDKMEVKREIITLITAKKLEANIMRLIPLGFIGFLLVSSPGFLNPLYHNSFGFILMTFLVGVYLVIYRMIDRIVTIEV